MDKSTIFENGTIIGALSESYTHNSNSNNNSAHKNLIIPEIVISASYSNGSLHRSRCDIVGNTSAAPTIAPTTTTVASSVAEETAVESTALLDAPEADDGNGNGDGGVPHDEFEQFILNRTTSESNMLESSIYSELQFPGSIGSASLAGGRSIGGCCSSGGSTAAHSVMVAGPQTPSSRSRTPASQAASPAMELLNSSACSRDSRQAKRTRRKHKSKSKCSVGSSTQRVAGVAAGTTMPMGGTYPPQYTTIYLDGGGAANAIGQLASAAGTSPFLQAPSVADATYLQQQYQYYQQRPLLSNLNSMGHHHLGHHHRTLLESGYNPTDAAAVTANGVLGNTAPAIASATTTTATTSPISPAIQISFRKWFTRPSLPFVIGILALGGVACTLGGIVLGSTGLIEHSTQYLSAALLMIGIGVSLLVISGAIWRLSLPDDTDECPCYRHMETCRNCNSPYCNNRLLPGSYLYPEFQHRPPPPSYLTSLNECAAMGLLFHPAGPQAAYSTVRMNTPPPLYRSTNSLSVYVPGGNSNSMMTSPVNVNAITMPNNTASILPEQNAILESLQTQTQPMTKEINYLELD